MNISNSSLFNKCQKKQLAKQKHDFIDMLIQKERNKKKERRESKIKEKIKMNTGETDIQKS